MTLALGVSLEHLATVFSNDTAQVLADTLDVANTKFLVENKSPLRSVHELDNRGSHFYLALYWAEALAAQDKDAELKARFAPLAETLSDDEDEIVEELIACQGAPLDIGYCRPNDQLVTVAMRPKCSTPHWLGCNGPADASEEEFQPLEHSNVWKNRPFS